MKAEHYTRLSETEDQHAHPDCGCLLQRDGAGISLYLCALHEAASTMRDMLYKLLPYIETAKDDPHYKQGAINKVVRDLRAIFHVVDKTPARKRA